MRLIKKYLNPSGPIYSTIALPEVEVKPRYPRMPKESDYMSDELLAEAFAVPQEYYDAASLRYLLNLYHTNYEKFKQEWERLHPGSTAEGRQAMKDLQVLNTIMQHRNLAMDKWKLPLGVLMGGAVAAPLAGTASALGTAFTEAYPVLSGALKGATNLFFLKTAVDHALSDNGFAKTKEAFQLNPWNMFGEAKAWMPITDGNFSTKGGLLDPNANRGWAGSALGDAADVLFLGSSVPGTYRAGNAWALQLARQFGVLGAAADLSKIVGMKLGELEYKIMRGQVTLSDLEQVLTTALARKLYNGVRGGMNTKEKQDLLKKAVAGTKGKKGANKEILETQAIINQRVPAKVAEDIRKRYADQIAEIYERTGINWSDLNGVMRGMPDELRVAKVGFDTQTPFLERYYKNVLEATKEGGILDQLLRSGELRLNSRRLWEGKVGDRYIPVDPTDYIKMRMANNKGHNFSLAPRYSGEPNYPMHGTMSRDYKYITNPSSEPGRDGYFTVIQDDAGIKSGLLGRYKGNGASIPFFRIPEYELPLSPHGNHNSNAYGEARKSLLEQIRLNPGRILKPTAVSNPSGTGMRVNEYDFGPNIPNPKSLWNTLDFEPGAGPLAFVSHNENTNNLA